MSESARVITVTPAPAIDRTYVLDSFELGEVHRASEVHSEIAGKGVNVSTNLNVADVASIAVVPLSPEDSAGIESTLLVAHPISQRVRVNITVLEDGGRTTKINEKAPALTSSEWASLVDTTLALGRANEASWILLAGTMPPCSNAPSLSLEELFSRAHQDGMLVGLDTSGTPLLNLARSGLPDLIKPNAPELAECVGRSLRTLGDVVAAAQEVHEWGVTHVLVSLGPDGMVGVSSSEVVHASTPPVAVRSTIGAGDASVAGFLSRFVSHPDEFSKSVGTAVAWGALKVQEVSSQLHSVEGLPEASITTSPDLTHALREPGLI